jgi:hypothetical protein
VTPPPHPTNRELYLSVRTQSERHRGGGLALEAYLRALWSLARPVRARASLSGEELIALLTDAWTAPAPPFDERWRGPGAAPDEAPGFEGWERRILSQIRDLREMEEAGTFESDSLYFGVAAPSGRLWYNFSPAAYLEAGVEGTFGGWQPGDAGRVLVPGEVAAVGPDGTITSVDAAEIDDPVEPLGRVTWERFADFLYSGQAYE